MSEGRAKKLVRLSECMDLETGTLFEGAFQHGNNCNNCPGALVDETFHCQNRPGYNTNPVEFYKLLKKLDRKRRKQLKIMKG